MQFSIVLVVALAASALADNTFSCSCSGCGTNSCNLYKSACSGSGTSFSGSGASCSCEVSADADCPSDSQSVCNSECLAFGCTSGSGDCGSSSSKCFPASASVTLEDGTTKTMAQLKKGDRVMVAAGQFSDVYFFSHQDASAVSDFVQIKTAQHTLQLTADHYLYVNGKLATAKTVKTGDMITSASGKPAPVTQVSTVRMSGLYNPHTLHGDVVVNNVSTSSYTAAIAPALAHAALLPVRIAYTLGQDVTGDAFNQGSDLIGKALPDGKDAY